MSTPEFLNKPHDVRDPDPWLALYLDQSTPLSDEVKAVWLTDSSSKSRQYLLPFVRPLARAFIILIQVIKTFLPKRWSHSKLLHRFLAWGLEHFVSPEAKWLILRHFHLGSQVLAFVARNAPVNVETAPLTPACIADLRDEMFLKHDLNLYNFVIRLNTALRAEGKTMQPAEHLDFSMIETPPLAMSDMPQRKRNFMDLESAIELFTPMYQLMLTDNDFWRRQFAATRRDTGSVCRHSYKCAAAPDSVEQQASPGGAIDAAGRLPSGTARVVYRDAAWFADAGQAGAGNRTHSMNRSSTRTRSRYHEAAGAVR